MGAIKDATSSVGKGIKKSLKSYGKEAERFARSMSDFVDVEDFTKSIHKVARPEEHAQRKTSIIHTPIDWSKHPPSAFKPTSVIEEEEEEEGEEEGREDEVFEDNNNVESKKDETGAGVSHMSEYGAKPRRTRAYTVETTPQRYNSSVGESMHRVERKFPTKRIYIDRTSRASTNGSLMRGGGSENLSHSSECNERSHYNASSTDVQSSDTSAGFRRRKVTSGPCPPRNSSSERRTRSKTVDSEYFY